MQQIHEYYLYLCVMTTQSLFKSKGDHAFCQLRLDWRTCFKNIAD